MASLFIRYSFRSLGNRVSGCGGRAGEGLRRDGAWQAVGGCVRVARTKDESVGRPRDVNAATVGTHADLLCRPLRAPTRVAPLPGPKCRSLSSYSSACHRSKHCPTGRGPTAPSPARSPFRPATLSRPSPVASQDSTGTGLLNNPLTDAPSALDDRCPVASQVGRARSPPVGEEVTGRLGPSRPSRVVVVVAPAASPAASPTPAPAGERSHSRVRA